MRLIKKDFYFESDEEIKEFIKLLKDMRKSQISYWQSLPKGYGLHNGKPSIPDYECGYTRFSELRKSTQTKRRWRMNKKKLNSKQDKILLVIFYTNIGLIGFGALVGIKHIFELIVKYNLVWLELTLCGFMMIYVICIVLGSKY